MVRDGYIKTGNNRPKQKGRRYKKSSQNKLIFGTWPEAANAMGVKKQTKANKRGPG